MKNIILFFALILSTTLISQNNFEGTVTQEITYEDMSPEMKANAALLPSIITTTIDHNLSRTATPTAMGETVVLSDSETGEIISLFNQAGNMIAVRSNSNETEKEEPEIEYFDETKEILGHECKKAIITQGENEVVVFYTKDLPDLESTNNKVNIDGFVMEMTINLDALTMITTVTEIKEEKVKRIKMQVPAEYKEMTMEEIKAMQGGGM